MGKNDENLVLKEIRALASAVKGIEAGVGGLKSEVRAMSSTVTSLDRQIGRMDTRLSAVEGHIVEMKKQTDLIPGISEAVGNFSADINNHETRIKNLEGAPA